MRGLQPRTALNARQKRASLFLSPSPPSSSSQRASFAPSAETPTCLQKRSSRHQPCRSTSVLLPPFCSTASSPPNQLSSTERRRQRQVVARDRKIGKTRADEETVSNAAEGKLCSEGVPALSHPSCSSSPFSSLSPRVSWSLSSCPLHALRRESLPCFSGASFCWFSSSAGDRTALFSLPPEAVERLSSSLPRPFRVETVWQVSPASLPRLARAAALATEDEHLRCLERRISETGEAGEGETRFLQRAAEADAEGDEEEGWRATGPGEQEEARVRHRGSSGALESGDTFDVNRDTLALSGVCSTSPTLPSTSSFPACPPSRLALLRAKGVLPSLAFWRHMQRRVEICDDLLSSSDIASLLLAVSKASPVQPAFVDFLFAELSRRASLFLSFTSSPLASSPLSSSPRVSRFVCPASTEAKAFLPPPLAISIFNLTLQRVSADLEEAEEAPKVRIEFQREDGDSVPEGGRNSLPASLPPGYEGVLMKALLVVLSRNCSFFSSSSSSSSDPLASTCPSSPSASTASSPSASCSSFPASSVVAGPSSPESVCPSDATSVERTVRNSRSLDAALLLASAIARYAHLARKGDLAPFSSSLSSPSSFASPSACSSPSSRSVDLVKWAILWGDALLPLLHSSLPQMSLKQTISLCHSLSRLSHHPLFFFPPSSSLQGESLPQPSGDAASTYTRDLPSPRSPSSLLCLTLARLLQLLQGTPPGSRKAFEHNCRGVERKEGTGAARGPAADFSSSLQENCLPSSAPSAASADKPKDADSHEGEFVSPVSSSPSNFLFPSSSPSRLPSSSSPRPSSSSPLPSSSSAHHSATALRLGSTTNDVLDPKSLSYAFHSVFLLDHAVNVHLTLQESSPPSRSPSVSAQMRASFFTNCVAPQLPHLLQSLMPFLSSSPLFTSPPSSFSSSPSPPSSCLSSSSPSPSSSPASSSSSSAAAPEVRPDVSVESESSVSRFLTPRFSSLSELLRVFLPLLTRQLLAIPAVSSLLLLHLSRHVSSLFPPSCLNTDDPSLVELKREEETRGTPGKRNLQQRHDRRLYLFLLSSLVTQNPSLSVARETVASHLLPSLLSADSKILETIPHFGVTSTPTSSPDAASGVCTPQPRAAAGSLDEFDAVEDARIFLQLEKLAREERSEETASAFSSSPAAKPRQTSGDSTSSPFALSLPSSRPSLSSVASASSPISSSVLEFDSSSVPLQRSIRGSLRLVVSPLLSSLVSLSPSELLQVSQLVVSSASLRHPVSLVSHLLGHLADRVHAMHASRATPRLSEDSASLRGAAGGPAGARAGEGRNASFTLKDLSAVATVGAQLTQMKSGRQGEDRTQGGSLKDVKAKTKQEIQIALQQQFRCLLVAVAEAAEAALSKAEEEEKEDENDEGSAWMDATVEGREDLFVQEQDDGEVAENPRGLGGVAGEEDGLHAFEDEFGGSVLDGRAERPRTRAGEEEKVGKEGGKQEERNMLNDPEALLELMAVLDVAGLARPLLASLVERRILSNPKFREIFGVDSSSREDEKVDEGRKAPGRRRSKKPSRHKLENAAGSPEAARDPTSTSSAFLHAHFDDILHLLHFLADSGHVAAPPASSLFSHLLPAVCTRQLLSSLSVDLLLCALDTLRRLLRHRDPSGELSGFSASRERKEGEAKRIQKHDQSSEAWTTELQKGSHSPEVTRHAERLLFAIQKFCLTKSFLGSLRNGELLLVEEVLRELGERNLQVEEERTQRQLPEPAPKRMHVASAL
ncbi:UNVERIFIED_CONTAM: hypothetical protein HHA_263760 [Hammondia hammondi]|eukprot:XP_008887307.1 hypothetical protein HHA_263760 [Hammondia hammondi]